MFTVTPQPVNPGLGSIYDSPTDTFVTFIPIEANTYAVRIGFAEPYNLPMQVVSATLYPTDNYAAARSP